ncbi:hypothetical protein DFJ74DRAFT_656613 [Hyaloraphidium curvatum]|nr:hypothetical protein DFJ74DRAFT_656613 [Hyaloraphidium curvatum]
MDEKRKRLAYAVLEFLGSTKESLHDEEKQESVDVAMQCISDVFGVDLADQSQQVLYSIKPLNLLSIFNVYLNTAAKKQTPAAPAPQPGPAAAKGAVTDADRKKAEEKKTAGNQRMGEKKYEEAIELYTEAIDLDPENAVYYANRAAAYSQSSQHEKAVDDARKAIDVDPKYSKAYSRLGLALYSLELFQDAVDAYEKGLKLDPSNAAMKQQLQMAKERAKASSPSGSSPASQTGPAPSIPGAGPGGFDINSMLSNPAIAQMAQQVMQNPEMLSSLMNNPMLQNLMGSMGGGGGAGGAGAGAPGGGGGGISDLLNNPELARMAANFLGGAGRGGS